MMTKINSSVTSRYNGITLCANKANNVTDLAGCSSLGSESCAGRETSTSSSQRRPVCSQRSASQSRR